MSSFNLTQKEKVIALIKDRSRFSGSFLLMNVLAAVIAGYGMLLNSPAIIIGAMLVALLLGPLTGVALALMESDHRLLRQSVMALAGGIGGVVVTSFVIGLIHADITTTYEMLSRTEPNILDLMVALAGGAAGAFATISPRLVSAFAGVAIATALVPPITAGSLLLARGELDLAAGAFILALTNVVAIQFAMSLVLWLAGFRRVTRKEGATFQTFLLRSIASLILLAVLAVALTINLRNAITKEVYETSTRTTLETAIAQTGDRLVDVAFVPQQDKMAIYAEVHGPADSIQPEQVADIEKELKPSPDGKPASLRIRYVHVVVTDKNSERLDTVPNARLLR